MSIKVGRKSCFSYLSHSSVGMSQLNHHGEVRGCELQETRENHLLASQSITANTLVTSATWEAHISAYTVLTDFTMLYDRKQYNIVKQLSFNEEE